MKEPRVKGKTSWKRMFMLFKSNKLNKLFVGAIIVGLAVPLLNVFIIYPHFYKQITDDMENSAIRLAKHMEGKIQENESWLVIMDGKRLPDEAKLLLNSYREDFDLSKIKIFSTEGIVVYSTEESNTGNVNRKNYFLQHVIKGEVFSKVVNTESLSLEGQQYSEDIIEIYVPILDGSNFAGAFELYYNITDQISALDKKLFFASIIPFTVSGVLLIALYWGFINLDNSLIEKEKAEAEVKVLQGIIPICMHCKGIRDDEGIWNQIESYIESRSDAQFSHGLCDPCLEKHYGKEMAAKVKLARNKGTETNVIG